MKPGLKPISLLAAGGMFLIGLLYYLMVLSPAMAERESLDRHSIKMKKDLVQMHALKARWESFVKSRSGAEKMLQERGKDFTLLTHLETVCRQVGVDNRIQYMKPLDMPEQEGPLRPVGVEMRISDIDVRQLVQLLYRIEHSYQLLSISRIKIRPSAEEGRRLLELVLQINTCM
ncbi:MAG: hypothetical protein C4576_16745 [Desulfobacteraceae bacterium]|nr:MAG: hypothetical protein C4576_16745 [Desulfobacteraceae bacterium]